MYNIDVPTLTLDLSFTHDLIAETLALILGIDVTVDATTEEGGRKPFSWSAPNPRTINPEAAAIADEYAALPLAERRA